MGETEAALGVPDLKRRVAEAIEARKDEIMAIGQDILEHPELGYKERRTAALVARYLRGLGVRCRTGLALTGVKGWLRGRSSRARLGILAELDSVLCPGHAQADPRTGAAHACGHNAQLTAMLGLAAGMVASGAMSSLDGDIALLAVPAEEYVEIEYRSRLRQEGKIRFLGGKQELIARGEFDDLDLAMMVHLGVETDGKKVAVGGTSNGFIGKMVRYRGREAHAGGSPHSGINALNAAMLGLMGVHAQRETFRDQDHIRVHPIITKGGDLVNIVPADVRLETYVRGATMEAVLDASGKVNRALRAGAAAVGAEVEIEELPGYMPQANEPRMGELFRANAAALLGPLALKEGGHGTGSSDMGDVMQIMPGIQPSVAGASGGFHSSDFSIADPYLAYVVSAKLLAMTAIDLLATGAAEALAVKRSYKAPHTKRSYLELWQKLLDTAPPAAHGI